MWVSYTEHIEIWVTAENAYNQRVSRVENRIIARLRHRLGRRAMRMSCLGFSTSLMHSSSAQRYVYSLPIAIFLLNGRDVDSWCDTGVPDSFCRGH